MLVIPLEKTLEGYSTACSLTQQFLIFDDLAYSRKFLPFYF